MADFGTNIDLKSGNLFDSGAHTLVNTVNCVGVMGAGLAKQFKQRYPAMFQRYSYLCRNDGIRPGSIQFDEDRGQSIINVAVKAHYSRPSEMEWITSGLRALAHHCELKKVPSIAVPPLGCGLGGLTWLPVFQEIIGHLGNLDTKVMVYAPQGSEEESAQMLQRLQVVSESGS